STTTRMQFETNLSQGQPTDALVLHASSEPLPGGSGLSDSDPALVRIFDVERLGLATFFLALLYLFLTLYAFNQLRKLRHMQRSLSAGSMHDRQSLLHSCVALHAALRCASFGVLAVFT